MITCKACGQQNPDEATRCSQCGLGLGHQIRAGQDARRGQVSGVVRVITWIVVLVVLALVARPAYRTVGAAYFKWRLNAATQDAEKACNGPVTDSTPSYLKDQIRQCLAGNERLSKAKSDYDDFTKFER